MSVPSQDALFAALSKVIDPEIRKPITELGMVESVGVDESGRATVTILLTISGCPLKETLTRDTTAALLAVEGVTRVGVTLGVMSDEQRTELRTTLRGGNTEREIPFARLTSFGLTLGFSSYEQRTHLPTPLRGRTTEREIPFSQPNSLTRVYC